MDYHFGMRQDDLADSVSAAGTCHPTQASTKIALFLFQFKFQKNLMKS